MRYHIFRNAEQHSCYGADDLEMIYRRMLLMNAHQQLDKETISDKFIGQPIFKVKGIRCVDTEKLIKRSTVITISEKGFKKMWNDIIAGRARVRYVVIENETHFDADAVYKYLAKYRAEQKNRLKYEPCEIT